MSDSEASDASDSDLSDVVSDEEGKIKRQARWAYNSLKEPGLSGSDDEERKPSRRTRWVVGSSCFGRIVVLGWDHGASACPEDNNLPR